MDCDGGVFLWNIIFKTCNALATELLQLYHIFNFLIFSNILWCLAIWPPSPQHSLTSQQREEEKKL